MKNSQCWVGELYDRFDINAKPILFFNKSEKYLVMDIGEDAFKKYLHMNAINIYRPEDNRGRRILHRIINW